MTEIRFYHLQTQSAEQALPGLVARAYDGGKRVVVRLRDAAQMERVNESLWTFNPGSFIPHGNARDGQPEEQPVWLTVLKDNPNNADTLMTLELSDTDWDERFSLVCLVFEGADETAVATARARWKALKDAGADLTYWQQGPQGGWEKK